MVKKIISGCQTGADQAGLQAAENLGLATGGWMPAGFRTATGPREDLANKYSLRCTSAGGYHVRTLYNVRDSDATLIFGRLSSSGSKLTARYADSLGKPKLQIPWGTPTEEAVAAIESFILQHKPAVLNIAGNREEKCPGIFDWVVEILEKALVQQPSGALNDGRGHS